MSVFDYDKNQDNIKPFHAAGMAENAAKRATNDNQDKYAKQDNAPSGGEEHYSLNDDRRVKVLSPGALVAKRFFRNRLAVVGLSILIFMFVFSFIGGLVSPYGEDEFFYRDKLINKEFAVVTENTDFRYMAKDSALFGSPAQAKMVLAIQKGEASFSYGGNNYTVAQEGEDFYSASCGGAMVGIAYKDVVNSSVEGQKLDFDFVFAALKAHAAQVEVEDFIADPPAPDAETEPAADETAQPVEKVFSFNGADYTIDEDGYVRQADGAEVAYISRYIVQAIMPDIFLSRDFKEKLIDTIAAGETKFVYTDESLILDDEPAADTSGEEGGIVSADDGLAEENTSPRWNIPSSAARTTPTGSFASSSPPTSTIPIPSPAPSTGSAQTVTAWICSPV